MPPKPSASTPTPPPTPNPNPAFAHTCLSTAPPCSYSSSSKRADLSRRAVEGLRRLSLDREQVLARLWEIANLSPEMTRGSITGQVKAISMIVAMENLIPDRLAVSSQKKSAHAPTQPQIYAAACPPRPAVGRARQEATTIDPQPRPAPDQEEERPGSTGVAPPGPGPSQPTFATSLSPSQAPPVATYVPLFASVPDLGGGFAYKEPLCPPPLSSQSYKRTQKYQVLKIAVLETVSRPQTLGAGCPICPDFLRRFVALIHSMRLSLMKGAHADLSSTAWQEIGVKPVLWT